MTTAKIKNNAITTAKALNGTLLATRVEAEGADQLRTTQVGSASCQQLSPNKTHVQVLALFRVVRVTDVLKRVPLRFPERVKPASSASSSANSVFDERPTRLTSKPMLT